LLCYCQVAAGGVHSLVLTIDGIVYSCGVNEKGTVPVEGLEAEETIDKFSEIVFSDEIKKLGKVTFQLIQKLIFYINSRSFKSQPVPVFLLL